MYKFSLLFFLLIGNKAISQNFSGNWVGIITQKSLTLVKPKSIELELEKFNDSLYTGVLHSLYGRGGYEHLKVSAVYHKKDSTFIMTEDSILSIKKSFFIDVATGINKLKFTKTDSSLRLAGKWVDKKKGIFKFPSIKLFFEKKLETNIPKKITQRIDDVQRVIDLKKEEADSIEIKLYDNGVIDNDSVSVILNDKYIVQNQRLNIEPLTYYFSLDKNIKLHKLILFAINMGEYPPNTAYMVVKTKKHSYSIHLSSTMEKNGTVELQIVD